MSAPADSSVVPAGGHAAADNCDAPPPRCPLCDPKSSHLRLAYDLKEASPVFRGRISTVYRATCSACGLPAAIKAYLPPTSLAPRHLLNLRREVEAMRRLAAVGAPHAQALVGQFEEEVEGEEEEKEGERGGREKRKGSGDRTRDRGRSRSQRGGLRLVTRWAEGGDCYAALGRATSAASAASARAAEAVEASNRSSSSSTTDSSSSGGRSSSEDGGVRRKIAAKTPLTFSSPSPSPSLLPQKNNPFFQQKRNCKNHSKSKAAPAPAPAAASSVGLPEHTAREICAAVLRCLAAAHAQGIVHRDVKPENVLLSGAGAAAVASAAEAAAAERFFSRSSSSSSRRQDNSNHRLLPSDVTLADWGLAIDALREPPRSRVGTLDYSAPELLRAGIRGVGVAGGGLSARSTAIEPTKPCSSSSPPLPPPYTSAVDVWAVGVLAFELLSGSAPFAPLSKQKEQEPKQNSKPCPPQTPAAAAAASAAAAAAAAAETEARVLSGERPDVSRLPDSSARSFVLSATAFDASERPTALALLSHDWIVGRGKAEGRAPSDSATFAVPAHAPSSVPAWTIGAAAATAAATAAAEAGKGNVAVVENNDNERDQQLERAETVLPREMSIL